MRFRARKTFRVGPYFRTYTQGGFSSHGLKVWRLTINFTRRTWSFDTPGPGGLRGSL